MLFFIVLFKSIHNLIPLLFFFFIFSYLILFFYFSFTVLGIAEDPCAHCSKHAVCIDEVCQCKDGFTGNGFYCERGRYTGISIQYYLFLQGSDLAFE